MTFMKDGKLTFGSLFAGIGGFDLGLERAGMQCEWQVEIDPFARRVLEKHWPSVRRHDDVRTFPPEYGDWGVDLICGGFPCQPVSLAGLRKGSEDSRWLWPEFARILRELRPRFAILENVPGLLSCGLDAILGDLASLGFDAEWSMLSACAMGAPHTRARLFVIAHSDRKFREARLGPEQDWTRQVQPRNLRTSRELWMDSVAPHDRGVDGVSDWSHRCRLLGNAVVPQVAEYLGRMILESCDK